MLLIFKDFIKDEEGAVKITKEKLVVLGLTGLLLLFAYSFIKKEYNNSWDAGFNAVESLNDKDPEALDALKDLPLDLERPNKTNKSDEK